MDVGVGFVDRAAAALAFVDVGVGFVDRAAVVGFSQDLWVLHISICITPETISTFDPLSQDILILKWTKYQLSVYDKMPMVYDCLMPVFHFILVSALFEKDGLKYKINRMHKFAHTNKYK